MIRAAAAIAAVSAALALWGCGGDDDSSAGGQSAGSGYSRSAANPDAQQGAEKTAAGGEKSAAPAQPRDAGITITTAGSEYGEILFDGEDRAIYLFEKETSPASECYGACAAAWPPVLTEGAPRAGGGAKASLLGTTRRDDGSTQVTYRSHPLYYYVDDPPGEVLCHNVVEFGGLWLVLQPGGDPVS